MLRRAHHSVGLVGKLRDDVPKARAEVVDVAPTQIVTKHVLPRKGHVQSQPGRSRSRTTTMDRTLKDHHGLTGSTTAAHMRGRHAVSLVQQYKYSSTEESS
jgi:hypothetical protein